MRLAESRIRQIIREEARRVLSEQAGGTPGTFQQAGAAIQPVVGYAKRAVKNVLGVADADEKAYNVQQAADFIVSIVPEPLKGQLGGPTAIRDGAIKAFSATFAITGAPGQAAQAYKGAAVQGVASVGKLLAAVQAMHGQGQIVAMMTRLAAAKKGVPEIMGAVADAVLKRAATI